MNNRKHEINANVNVNVKEREKENACDLYNSVNIQITPADITEILSKYNVHVPITNFNLYRRAFIHHSYLLKETEEEHITPASCIPLSSKSNERLEFIGDGVLECITKYYLYRRFPLENEGFMTEKKIALVKNEAIGKVAYEMGLHKWFILSKQTEEKQMRYNFKKLGCLFEALIGAIFLDFNKIKVHDSDNLFQNIFVTGPGFQIAQNFIEAIFEKHIDWTELIQNDDNYKNILQVKIQREFKVTPDYLEISPYSHSTGYHMGVYLCLGQMIYNLKHANAISLDHFSSFQAIHDYVSIHGKLLLFLGEGKHKIKKKAEQSASSAFGKNTRFLS